MKQEKGNIWYYINRHKFSYALGIGTLLAVDVLNLKVPQFISEIIDGLSTSTLTTDGVIKIVVSLIFVCLGVSVGRILWRIGIFGAARKVETEIRNDMFEKLEELSQYYYNAHKTGDLMANFTNDLDALRNAIGPAVLSVVDGVALTIMVLYRMIVYVNFKLTLLTLIPMSFIGIGGYFVGNILHERFMAKQKAFASLSDVVQESVQGERVIKAFTQEEKQDAIFQKANIHNKNMNMRVVKLFATMFPVMDLVIGASYVITIIYGGYLAIVGEITLGRFVAFNSYIAMLIWPLIAMGDCITQFSQGRAAIGRIKQIFDEVPDIVDDANPDDVSELTGNIEFKDVTFTYGEEFEDALSNLNFTINQGETFAILGRTGAGKTTLVNLLSRLYDTTQGTITLDGHDIKKIPLKVLRNSIAYVPQDNYLFSDTLENNIKFGKLDASSQDVIEACQDACVHDNIIEFADGYQTVVGERGVTLSGGQKQRCSIARALLKDAPILVLDDSLSAVDTDTEDQILENLKNKRQNKTTIMIAHRVSTIKNADHIFVLEDGKNIEYGTFDELMALNGTFKEMYEKQQLEKQLVIE